MNKYKSVLNAIRNPNKLMRALSFILLFAFLNLELGCNYYRVRTLERMNEDVSRTKLMEYQSKNKYIILNCRGERYHLSAIEINKEDMTLSANSSKLDEYHNLYYPDVHSNARYRNSRGEYRVINEVHLLAKDFSKTADSKITISLKDITRMDIIEQDTGRTIASYVFLSAGIAAATLVLLIIIILLTKSSCPFVYVKDGTNYNFKGELFGGAIYKPLERDDYIGLKSLNKTDSVLQIKISNELLERQYTDIAETIVAECNKGVTTLIDSKGIVHTVNNPKQPIKAELNHTADMTDVVAKIDSSSCLFDTQLNKQDNELSLTFKKTSNTGKANLILHAKNSLWLDYAFGEFTKLFGLYYNSWIEKQRNANADTLNNWINKQSLPLSVYVKNNNEWKLIERIPTIGPLAFRDLCIPINYIPSNSQNLEIKLSSGFLFWEVDYAAVDFTDEIPVHTFSLTPNVALNENGTSCKAELSQIDKKYLYQPGAGYTATITYKLPALNNNKHYDVYLHTKGYYEHKRSYTGLPEIKLLQSFKREHAFEEFSESLYNHISTNTNVAGLISR